MDIKQNLKVLILHNHYQQPGGEDVVVANESALLKEHGHEVHLQLLSNDSIQGPWRKMITALQTPYSWRSRREMIGIINNENPDVVHVHNFFPLLTPSIYDACQDAGVPVVQTLHNYRTICPGALLMREGKVCEDCIQGTPYQAVLHGCYRGSRLGSLAVARMVDIHRRQGTWSDKVDRFIALTESAKKKFVAAGFPAEKIAVKPNFIEATPTEKFSTGKRSGALFVGRLSPEKGIGTLLEAWEKLDVSLRIVGDGPLLDMAKVNISEFLTVLGRRKRTQIFEEMSRAAFLVMPSEWYETFGLTIIEAFSQSLPVIASRLGAMAELVEDGVTGLHFTPGDAEDLARKVRWANEHPEEMRRMGRNARLIYEEKYTSEVNYLQLMAIYEEAIEENNHNRAACL